MTLGQFYEKRAATSRSVRGGIEKRGVRPGTAPVKVIYIISDLSIGGAEMMLYKLLAETNRERFEPAVISLMDQGSLRERIEALGIAVHTVGMTSRFPTPRVFWRLVGLIRRLKPDLILGWMYHGSLAAQLSNICSSRRAPVLWSIHYSVNSLSNEKWLTAMVIRACAFLSRLPAKIIFVSQSGQAQHKLLGYDIENSCVIPNGINTRQFSPSVEARRSVRSELGLPESAFLIGIVSRYHPVKDHATFLRAAALLSRTHPEAHFLLVGRSVDRHNRALRDLIQELGLSERTCLAGERDDMPRLMAALDVFSLTSSYGESFPNVIGEAMACGMPCVVTDVGDSRWIVGDTGRIVPPSDPAALADAWREMIERGTIGRMALGRAARSRVIERFPLKSIVTQYEAVYDTLSAQESLDQFSPAAIDIVESRAAL